MWITTLTLTVSASVILCCSTTLAQGKADFIDDVNPFIGTGRWGNTVPAAMAPFGMISWGPNTTFDDYQWYDARPGYKYDKDGIISFSLTHYNGIGCHAKRDIPFSITSQPPINSPVHDREAYRSGFSKAHESASPGEYRVLLDEGQINVKMTSSERASLAVLNFHEEQGHVVIAPTNNANGISHAYLEVVADQNLIRGHASTGGFCDHPNTDFQYTLYFVAVADCEIIDFGMWEGEERFVGQTTAQGDNIAAYISLGLENHREVKLKTAISYVSMDNAMLNLQAEVPGWDYEDLRSQTRRKWNDALSKVEMTSSNPDDYEVFYTALYRNCHHPNIFEDVNGEYIGFDNQIHKVEQGRHFYVNFSLWDTYRTSAQLQAILFPQRMNDMLASLLLSAEQGGGGMPVWTLNNTDNGCMNGISGTPFMANAYAFGATGVDLNAMKELMISTAMEEIPIKDSRGWGENKEYREYGYVPHPFKKSVSKTVEYSIADYAISQICKAANDEVNHQYFLERSHSVFNLFNPEHLHLQKKDRLGQFVEPFSLTDTEGFEEGNTTHYTFGIPHATGKLVEALGGADTANRMLDEFFSHILYTDWHIADPYYWLGNEPCFGLPFVYHYTGRSYQSQKQIKEIISYFKPGPDGLSGDEDAGAMSAYYLFGAIGLYPYIPGEGGFMITGPIFEKVVFNLDNGAEIVIHGQDASPEHPYIGSVRLNGETWMSSWVDWESLENGAVLDFRMQDTPNPSWGALSHD